MVWSPILHAFVVMEEFIWPQFVWRSLRAFENLNWLRIGRRRSKNPRTDRNSKTVWVLASILKSSHIELRRSFQIQISTSNPTGFVMVFSFCCKSFKVVDCSSIAIAPTFLAKKIDRVVFDDCLEFDHNQYLPKSSQLQLSVRHGVEDSR